MQALSSLLVSLGFVPSDQRTPSTSVAVWDLIGFDLLSFPDPADLPTIALVLGDEGEVHQLLLLGYSGYVGVQCTGSQLRRALEAIQDGEIWAERRLVAKAFAHAIGNAGVRAELVRQVVRG
jgi:hypothetical protein